MNVFVLKSIALLTMLIDHVAAVFLQEGTTGYLILRSIGRISFPIYCFLLVEGYLHTRNKRNYMIRLGIFALLSEIPFDVCFYKQWIYLAHQNVFFTLFFGLLTIWVLDLIQNKVIKKNMLTILSPYLWCAVMAFVAWFLRTDYQMMGIFLILAFYVYREQKNMLVLAVFVICMSFGNLIQLCALGALVPIAFYNGKKGPSMKYVFYGFYPIHLLVLALLQNAI